MKVVVAQREKSYYKSQEKSVKSGLNSSQEKARVRMDDKVNREFQECFDKYKYCEWNHED